MNSDPTSRSTTLATLAPVLMLLALPVALAAQPPAAPEGLRADLEAEYQVTPIRGGIVLLPRDRERGIALIEVRGRRVYIDGNGPFPAQSLAAELGADAALLLRLTNLDPQTQRSTLGLPSLTDEDADELARPPERSEPAAPDVSAGAVPSEPVAGVSGGRGARARRVVRHDIVRVGGDVHVAIDERVQGDVVVIGGRLRVDGEVSQDVTVIGGSASFGPEAVARREVTIVGGKLIRAPGARFDRGVNEVNLDMIDLDFADFGWPRVRLPRFRSLDLVGTLIRFAFFGLLGSVVLLVAAGSSERVAQRVTLEPLKAGVVGFLAQLLFVPLLITGILLLVVTIIGIPLLALVPVVLLGAVVVLVLGFTGVAQSLSRLLASGPLFGLVLFWVGLVLLMTPTVFGEAFDLMGAPFRLFAALLGVTGFVIEYLAWTTGTGAVILNWFGAPVAAGAAPLPPLPAASGEVPSAPQPPAPPVDDASND